MVAKPASAPSSAVYQDLHKNTQSASSSANKPVAPSTSVPRPIAAQSYQANQDLYKNSQGSSSTANSAPATSSIRPVTAQSNKVQQELHQSTQVASSTKKTTTAAKPAAIQSYKVNQDLYKTGQASATSYYPVNKSSTIAQTSLHKSSKDGDSLSLSFLANQKSTSEDKQLNAIYAALAKQYPSNSYLTSSNKSDHAISYEGMRKVVGGNGSGTPDGLAPISVAAYDFFLSDIGTIISKEATTKEKLEAAAYTFIKPAKVLETGHDLAKAVEKTKDVAAKEKEVVENTAKGTGKAEVLERNRVAGREFEKESIEKLKNSNVVVEQITVRTKSGTKTRVDAIGVDKTTGNIVIEEYKASSTAPLTKNQKVAFPEILESGGTVLGKGKPPFYGGTEIPPTKINIVRKN